MTLRDQLIEFHKMVEQPILSTPQVPSEDRVRLRARLITEEFFETMEAMFSRADRNNINDLRVKMMDLIEHGWIQIDMPEFADGMADLDYVVEGTRLEFGIDGGPIAAEVHRANMDKQAGPKRPDGKILKPEGWKPPDISLELRKQGWK